MADDIKRGLRIDVYMYDVNTVQFRVVDDPTNLVFVDCCRSLAEAEAERDAYLAEQDAFIAGPFSAAQCS